MWRPKPWADNKHTKFPRTPWQHFPLVPVQVSCLDWPGYELSQHLGGIRVSCLLKIWKEHILWLESIRCSGPDGRSAGHVCRQQHNDPDLSTLARRITSRHDIESYDHNLPSGWVQYNKVPNTSGLLNSLAPGRVIEWVHACVREWVSEWVSEWASEQASSTDFFRNQGLWEMWKWFYIFSYSVHKLMFEVWT